MQDKLNRVRGLTEECCDLVLRLLQNITSAMLNLHSPQTTVTLWHWSDKEKDLLKEFTLSNKRVYLFFLPQDFNHSHLHAIWDVQLEENEWREFWNALWTSDLTTKGKVFEVN
jgi:hypothetical protein